MRKRYGRNRRQERDKEQEWENATRGEHSCINIENIFFDLLIFYYLIQVAQWRNDAASRDERLRVDNNGMFLTVLL